MPITKLIILRAFISTTNIPKAAESIEKVSMSENKNLKKTAPLEKYSHSATKNIFGLISKKIFSKKTTENYHTKPNNIHEASDNTEVSVNTGSIISTGARPKNNFKETPKEPTQSITCGAAKVNCIEEIIEPTQGGPKVTVNISGISYADTIRRDIAPLRSAPPSRGDNTFDSHRNKNRKQKSEKKNYMHSDIDSDESARDWEDGPLQLAPNPNNKYYINNQYISAPPPTRQWPVENYGNTNCNYKSQGDASRTQFIQPHPPSNTNRPNLHDRAQSNRPERIEKRSYHVSATDPDGEVVLEQEATYEDDFEVYRSTAYKKKVKRLEKLKERTNQKELGSAKNSISTRFVLTRVEPEQTVEDVEFYLLENFEEINDVYVRKNPMTHDKYATFVFIISSENEIDVRMIEDHDWPGRVKCFFSPNERHRRY